MILYNRRLFADKLDELIVYQMDRSRLHGQMYI